MANSPYIKFLYCGKRIKIENYNYRQPIKAIRNAGFGARLTDYANNKI